MTSNRQRMSCMEIWGGNRAIEKSFEAPGLDNFVHSAPYKESQTGGGDIYYLTSCASGRISRFLLADVSGHGEAASKVAVSLRDLLRENVNKISQTQFVTQMNREFGDVADESLFATAVVATFFEPKKSLSISVAEATHSFFTRQKVAANFGVVDLERFETSMKQTAVSPIPRGTPFCLPAPRMLHVAGKVRLLFGH